MKCPITGVNIPRYVLSSALVFVFIFLFEWAFHSKFMMDYYLTTMQLWRPEHEMGTYFNYLIGMQVASALAFTMLYTRNHEGKGILEGVRFGLFVGVFVATLHLQTYAWMPVPFEIPLYWAIGAVAMFVGAGVIASVTYCGSCCGGTCKMEDKKKK